MEYFNARPRARPMTSWGGPKNNLATQNPSSHNQDELLKDIIHGSAKQIAVRPQTAATTTLQDETRILNKLKYLEKIEQKIEDDLDDFINKRGDKHKDSKKGIKITKSILLEASNSDTLASISSVSLYFFFKSLFLLFFRLFYVIKILKFLISHIQEPMIFSKWKIWLILNASMPVII